MAVYRINKNCGYTVMADFHLRDKSTRQIPAVHPSDRPIQRGTETGGKRSGKATWYSQKSYGLE